MRGRQDETKDRDCLGPTWWWGGCRWGRGQGAGGRGRQSSTHWVPAKLEKWSRAWSPREMRQALYYLRHVIIVYLIPYHKDRLHEARKVMYQANACCHGNAALSKISWLCEWERESVRKYVCVIEWVKERNSVIFCVCEAESERGKEWKRKW